MAEQLKTTDETFCCGVKAPSRTKLDLGFCVSCIHRYLMGDLTIPSFHHKYFGYSLLFDLKILTKDQLDIIQSEKQLSLCSNASKVAFIPLFLLIRT